jgi:hypothetical protein
VTGKGLDAFGADNRKFGEELNKTVEDGRLSNLCLKGTIKLVNGPVLADRRNTIVAECRKGLESLGKGHGTFASTSIESL